MVDKKARTVGQLSCQGTCWVISLPGARVSPLATRTNTGRGARSLPEEPCKGRSARLPLLRGHCSLRAPRPWTRLSWAVWKSRRLAFFTPGPSSLGFGPLTVPLPKVWVPVPSMKGRAPSFSLLRRIPLCKCTIVFSSTHLLMVTEVASSTWLL